jgi:hypothetical protein
MPHDRLTASGGEQVHGLPPADRLLVTAHCQLATRNWRLPTGNWQLATGYGTSIDMGTTTVPQWKTSSACLPSTMGK